MQVHLVTIKSQIQIWQQEAINLTETAKCP